MKQFYLVETTTKDKLIHQGIFFKPSKATKRALLFVHGLTSNFYGNIKLFEVFTESCEENGLAFASFNNRGHDMITSLKKVDRRKPKGYASVLGGAGLENFRDSVFDIESGINFLVNQGFTEIILMGHSTGANKVCFYAGSKKHKNILGFILASPTSDRLGRSLDKIKLNKDLEFMQELINRGKDDKLVVGYHFFPLTPRRFMSLFTASSDEDTFDYGDLRPRLTYFSQIKKPLFVILGSHDEHLDRSAKKVMEVYDAYQKSANYKNIIFKDALHSFNSKEAELVREIITWIKSL